MVTGGDDELRRARRYLVSCGLGSLAGPRPWGARLRQAGSGAGIAAVPVLGAVLGLSWVAVVLAVLALVLVLAASGIRWVVYQLLFHARSTTTDLSGALVRAVPILAASAGLLLYNADVWQAADTVDGAGLALALLALAASAAVVLRGDAPGAPTAFDVEELRAAGARAGLARTDSQLARAAAEPAHPLTRRERLNVAVVSASTSLVPVLRAALVAGAALTLLSACTISPTVQDTWLGHPVDALELGPLAFTATGAVVVSLLSAFAALTVAVTAATDTAYRAAMLGETEDAVSHALAVRHLLRTRA